MRRSPVARGRWNRKECPAPGTSARRGARDRAGEDPRVGGRRDDVLGPGDDEDRHRQSTELPQVGPRRQPRVLGRHHRVVRGGGHPVDRVAPGVDRGVHPPDECPAPVASAHRVVGPDVPTRSAIGVGVLLLHPGRSEDGPRTAGVGPGQHEGANAPRRAHCQALGDESPHRPAQHVGLGQAQRGDQSVGVGGEGVEAQPAREGSGVAEARVVVDDDLPLTRQDGEQRRVPLRHGRAGAVQHQQRRRRIGAEHGVGGPHSVDGDVPLLESHG